MLQKPQQKKDPSGSWTRSGNTLDLTFAKVPPQARDLEEAVLGALLLEPQAIDQALLYLRPESFYVDAHQRIYAAILRLQQRSNPIDIYTVVQELMATDELEKVGRAHYLTKLTNSVVSGANVEYHSKLIAQKFMRREMIRISGEIISSAYEEGDDVYQTLDQAEELFMSIGKNNIPGDVISIDDVLMKAVEKIEEWRKQDSTITGIPSGFPGLDRATRGWQPGDLIILAARPSVGKTALALNIIDTAANNPVRPVPVAVWSLEMESVQLALRMLSSRSKIVLHRIQTGRMDDDQMKQLHTQGVQKLANNNIFFDDTSGLTLFKLRSKARRLKKKHGIGLIVIDYMQLMSGSGDDNNREQEISRISRGLKLLAKELQIPIISLSQLSRDVEKRTGAKRLPQLSDLRESGAIEQDADVVIFLWAPEDQEIKSNADLLTRRYARIAKQRNGMLITVNLDFKNEIQHFEEAVKEKEVPKDLGAGNWRPVAEGDLFDNDK